MNYDHAFHAGNHADVLKHLVLQALLDTLKHKPAPFFVLDTHAGQGRYALDAEAARRSGEAAAGILRLRAACNDLDALDPALRSYLAALEPHLAQGRYPGSPQLVADALRDADRLACCELQPDPAVRLKSLFRHDRRVAIHQRDGYEAIKALLPPQARRGLVLIDPPYESQLAEFDLALDALCTGLARWPQGCFALWYPIKQRRALHPFLREAAALPARSVLLAELFVHADDTPLRLNGSGMLLCNPPWQLDVALAPALRRLAEILGEDAGQWRLDWLRRDA